MPFNLSPSRGFDTSARARFTNKACRINIFFALGAAGDDLRANYRSREVMYSMLAMDAFSLHPVH